MGFNGQRLQESNLTLAEEIVEHAIYTDLSD